ncbi:43848_t:CDS:2 [Gigaspora margarita]|uniref:43848_t:CDS:1 n=1 Tax=Gigaspora margarita TaxID=4874 RepID=A0ABN7URZ6_GIGMA|nr:43848_t:CDS:2 [Gigaspora margarita]
MVVIKLRSVDIDDDLDSSTSQLSGSPVLINKKVISSVVRRVVWYPVVPLVAQFCNSFLETYAYVNRLLNAIVFSQDIAVTRAFQAVKLHWWITNVNTYDSKGNKTSQTNISGINTRSFSPTSHLIDIPKCTAGNDNGWVGVKVVNGEQTRRVSDEFINGFSSDIDKSQDIEEFNLILKKL